MPESQPWHVIDDGTVLSQLKHKHVCQQRECMPTTPACSLGSHHKDVKTLTLVCVCLCVQIASMVTVLGESKPRVKNILTLGSCAAIVGAEVSIALEPLTWYAWYASGSFWLGGRAQWGGGGAGWD
jgi:hypothetical protein